jgi:peptidoglycan/xylan/chitin deacetylase (PgdA/CDA1 family)
MVGTNDDGFGHTMQQTFLFTKLTGDSACTDMYSITPESFFQHLAVIHDRARRKATVPVITFDGGHRSHLLCALPILDSFSLKAHFFITTDWISNHSDCINWTEIRSLARAGHSIGSHTAKHAILPECTPAALERELIGSRKRLEDHIGQPVRSISMPEGRWNEAVLRGCALADYEVVYTSEPGFYRPPSLSSDLITPTVIGRLMVRGQTSVKTTAAYASGDTAAVHLLQAAYHLRHGMRSVLGNATYQRLSSHLSRTLPN